MAERELHGFVFVRCCKQVQAWCRGSVLTAAAAFGGFAVVHGLGGCLRGTGKAAFEFVDLVAQAGGFFKFQFFGGGEHLALQFAEGLGDVEIAAGVVDDRCSLAVVFMGVGGEAFLHGPDDAAGGDAVFGVIFDLPLAAGLADGEKTFDAAGHDIRVEDDLAVQVAGGAAGGLDEAGLAAEKALLVGIEDRDEGDLGEIEAFAEEVDADEDVKFAPAEGAEDLDAFDGVDVAVEVADVDADVAEVIGEFLGGALGKGGDKDAFLKGDALTHLLHEVIDLALEGFDDDEGVDQAGGAHDELGDAALGPGEFAG